MTAIFKFLSSHLNHKELHNQYLLLIDSGLTLLFKNQLTSPSKIIINGTILSKNTSIKNPYHKFYGFPRQNNLISLIFKYYKFSTIKFHSKQVKQKWMVETKI